MSRGKRKRPNRKPQQTSTSTAAPATHQRSRIVDARREADPAAHTSPDFTVNEPSSISNAFEWLRGKAELAWETRLLPLFSWVGGRFSRRRIRVSGRRVRHTGELGWSWERQGVGMLKRTTRMLMTIGISAAAIVLFAAIAIRISAAFAHVQPNINIGLGDSNNTATPEGAITIRNDGSGNGTPIGIPQYTLGMWPSNHSPGGGEGITVYAKVAQYSAPVVGVPVVFSIGGNNTTIYTNGDGLAIWHIGAGGPVNVPIEIDGEVKIGGQDLTASTFYSII
jgi:hypothetical protein